MSKNPIFIRRATLADAAAIAKVHGETWQQSYQGLVPASYLDELSVSQRVTFWQELIKTPSHGFHLFVAESERDGILGFTVGEFSRDHSDLSTAELTALYVHPSVHRQGIGRRLFMTTLEQFFRDGCSAMHLWVLEGNPAHLFYERMMGQKVGAKNREIGGKLCQLLGYRWDLNEEMFQGLSPDYRHPCIKHYTELEEPVPGHYPGSSEPLSQGAPLGRFFGFTRLGIHHETLAPGRRTSWPHAESTEDELIFVLEGCPDAWIDGKLYRLKPGDAVGFKAGSGIAHTFINNSDSPARLMVIGDATRADNQVIYPKHPQRNLEIGNLLWQSAPQRNIGPHSGIPEPSAPAPRIESERIFLKRHEIELAAQMFAAVDPDRERLGRFLPWIPRVQTVADEVSYIQATFKGWAEKTLFDFGIFRKDDETYLGNIGVHTINLDQRSCDFGYWLIGDHEGQGYISEALKALERAMGNSGFRLFGIECDPKNHKSAQVPRSNGYQFVGEVETPKQLRRLSYRFEKTLSDLSIQ